MIARRNADPRRSDLHLGVCRRFQYLADQLRAEAQTEVGADLGGAGPMPLRMPARLCADRDIKQRSMKLAMRDFCRCV
jgi:hypothetical protein